jgi:hypothetical protein
MILKRVARVLCAAATLCACVSQPRADDQASSRERERAAARQSARTQVAERARRLELLLGETPSASAQPEPGKPLRIIGMDEGPVPEFELLAAGGGRYSSKMLVGQQAFVAVFFATWCDYCSVELKSLQHALGEVGPMPVIPVSADGTETWHEVAGYLAQHGIHQPAVRARQYPLFSAAYDPFDTVPVVVIVGRNGKLVDYHLGYHPAHAERLVTSLRLAKRLEPAALPQLNAAN